MGLLFLTICGYRYSIYSACLRTRWTFKDKTLLVRISESSGGSSHWNLHADLNPAPPLDSLHEGHWTRAMLDCGLSPCSLRISDTIVLVKVFARVIPLKFGL